LFVKAMSEFIIAIPAGYDIVAFVPAVGRKNQAVPANVTVDAEAKASVGPSNTFSRCEMSAPAARVIVPGEN
jgi:hypothetical protein